MLQIFLGADGPVAGNDDVRLVAEQPIGGLDPVADVALEGQRRDVVERDVACEQDSLLRQIRDGIADRVRGETRVPELDLAVAVAETMRSSNVTIGRTTL